MSQIPRETVLQAMLPILSEAFAGPADPRSTHFVNKMPGYGLFGTGALRQIARHALGGAEAAAA